MTEPFLLKLQTEASKFIKKKTLAQVFYCEFLRNFYERPFTLNTSGGNFWIV